MPDPHPINRVLLTILDNQVARTEAALEGLDGTTFTAEPGHDCNTIAGVGRHLIALRRFQLSLLESPRAERVEVPASPDSVETLRARLDAATAELRAAIAEHDPDDWYRSPPTPREGLWGEDPTIERLVRPLNDFTNHLGSIRAVRRAQGHPAERTQ